MSRDHAPATPLPRRGRGRSVGIFGGSFNPIHVGHIALAKAVRAQCGLDEVWLMVSPQNPLKQQSDLLADQLRFELATKALAGVDGVTASDYEFHLPRPSYTWNTLQHLTRDYPDHQFSLIIGGDNWAAFQRWYRGDDILRSYDIIVYPRRGETLVAQGVHVLSEAPLLDVSSTEVRRRVRAGESISGLVPDTIADDVLRLY